jgi:hypothetical protein
VSSNLPMTIYFFVLVFESIGFFQDFSIFEELNILFVVKFLMSQSILRVLSFESILESAKLSRETTFTENRKINSTMYPLITMNIGEQG